MAVISNCQLKCRSNVIRCRTLLAEAGLKPGFSVDFSTSLERQYNVANRRRFNDVVRTSIRRRKSDVILWLTWLHQLSDVSKDFETQESE